MAEARCAKCQVRRYAEARGLSAKELRTLWRRMMEERLAQSPVFQEWLKRRVLEEVDLLRPVL